MSDENELSASERARIDEEDRIKKFFKTLRKFQLQANDRLPYYLNEGIGDLTFQERTMMELYIDLIERVEALEKLLSD
jgi:hypothetical protein